MRKWLFFLRHRQAGRELTQAARLRVERACSTAGLEGGTHMSTVPRTSFAYEEPEVRQSSTPDFAVHDGAALFS